MTAWRIFHSPSDLISPDVIDKTSEKRPEFVRAREPDYMLSPFDQLELRIGYQMGHLLNRPTRANIFGAVDEQRRYFQTRHHLSKEGF